MLGVYITEASLILDRGFSVIYSIFEVDQSFYLCFDHRPEQTKGKCLWNLRIYDKGHTASGAVTTTERQRDVEDTSETQTQTSVKQNSSFLPNHQQWST